MSVDKLVDSTQLDSDLTSIANAIRAKGGTSASLAFPADFVSAINALHTSIYREYSGTFAAFVANGTLPLDSLAVAIDNANGVSGLTIYKAGKNLLGNTLPTNHYPNGNTDYTRNADGSATITCTNASNLLLGLKTFTFKAGVTYSLSGCPAGGSFTTYRLYYAGSPGDNYDIGNGATFTLSQDTTAAIRIGISGTYTDLEFKPMIRVVGDDTFEPYSLATISVSFPTPPGTVTSGTCDIVNGLLTTGGTDYSISDQSVQTLAGANTFWCDDGNISAKFWEPSA